MTMKVSVKWQRNTYEVEVDLEQPPLVFKTQLFSLTGVPPERQKIMVKGGMLKDHVEWASTNVKEGSKLMMMGSAEAVVKAPETEIKFIEDLPEDQQEHAATKEEYGTGLVNLGNTCYMNSTLQCLRVIPELRGALSEYRTKSSGQALSLAQQSSHKLSLELSKVFSGLETSYKPVPPMEFLMQLREKFPQFAQQGEGGMYMQQDAEECWTNIVYCLRECLDPSGDVTTEMNLKTIKGLFGIGLSTTLESVESGEKSTEQSSTYALKCNITSDVNYLHEGIKLGLQEDREKRSELLGRDVLFKGKSEISSLPEYLTVQMVRFFYKQDVNKKAKILRPVTFPLNLDIYADCSKELKEKLDEPRKRMKEAEDAEVMKKKKAAEDAKEETAAAPAQTEGDTVMEDSPSTKVGVDATGNFELIAVLTHKGRSADSGHYVAWAKNDKGKWVEFDDETPKPRKPEDISALKGGGDWHMAYMCLYKAKKA